MRPGLFVVGMLLVAGFAAVVLTLLWRSPPPAAGQPPHQPPQERTGPAPAPAGDTR